MDDPKENKVSLYHVIGVIKDLNFTSWRRFAPGQPFSYTFMDEEFNELYRTVPVRCWSDVGFAQANNY